jgi:hypothetical protein
VGPLPRSILSRRGNGAYLEPMAPPAHPIAKTKAKARAAARDPLVIHLDLKPSNAREARIADLVREKVRRIRKGATVRYGSASMKWGAGQETALVDNILRGQQALKKAKKKVVKPGVALRARKDVPMFFADPSNPKRLIRELNGKRETGVFEDGAFKALW